MFPFTGSSRPHCFTFSNKIAEVGGEPGWARQVRRAVMKWRSSASVLFLRRCRLQTVCSVSVHRQPSGQVVFQDSRDERELKSCWLYNTFCSCRSSQSTSCLLGARTFSSNPSSWRGALDKHSATGVIKMSADAATLTDEYWCDVDAVYSLHPADALSQQLTEKNTDQLLRWGRKHGGDGAGGARLQEHVKKKNETSMFFLFVSHLFVLSFFLFSFFVRDLDPCPAPVWSYKTQDYVLSSPCCIF